MAISVGMGAAAAPDPGVAASSSAMSEWGAREDDEEDDEEAGQSASRHPDEDKERLEDLESNAGELQQEEEQGG